MKYIEYDSSFSEEEKKQAKALKVACNLNDAACKLKLKDYNQAAKLCTKVRNYNTQNEMPVILLSLYVVKLQYLWCAGFRVGK